MGRILLREAWRERQLLEEERERRVRVLRVVRDQLEQEVMTLQREVCARVLRLTLPRCHYHHIQRVHEVLHAHCLHAVAQRLRQNHLKARCERRVRDLRRVAAHRGIEDRHELLEKSAEQIGVQIPQEFGHGGEGGQDVRPGVLILELQCVEEQLDDLLRRRHRYRLRVNRERVAHDRGQAGVVGDKIDGQRLVQRRVGGGETLQYLARGGDEEFLAVLALLLEVVAGDLEKHDVVFCNVLLVVGDLGSERLERLEGRIDDGVVDETVAVQNDLDGTERAVVDERAAVLANLR